MPHCFTNIYHLLLTIKNLESCAFDIGGCMNENTVDSKTNLSEVQIKRLKEVVRLRSCNEVSRMTYNLVGDFMLYNDFGCRCMNAVISIDVAQRLIN